MTVAQRDVVPNESNQEYLLELWKQCLVEMLANVEEVKARYDDAFQAVKANSTAAVADARASYSDTLIKLEQTIEERLGKLRKLIDDKNGPRIHPFEDGKVHYEGELVTYEGSTFQALRDTGKAPPEESDWICVAAGGLDGRSPRVKGTYSPNERYSQLDIVALNGAAFIARRNNPGGCPGDGWQAIALQGKRGQQGVKGERGERGAASLNIKSWKLEPESYVLTPIMESGCEGPTVNLRPFFEQYNYEHGV